MLSERWSDEGGIHQAPVVQKVDSTIQRIHLRQKVQFVSLIVIHRLVIYPVDSAVQLLNNWGQICSQNWAISFHHIAEER